MINYISNRHGESENRWTPLPLNGLKAESLALLLLLGLIYTILCFDSNIIYLLIKSSAGISPPRRQSNCAPPTKIGPGWIFPDAASPCK